MNIKRFKKLHNMGVYTVSGSGADCKSVVFRLGWFDSISSHQIEPYKPLNFIVKIILPLKLKLKW